MTTINASVRPSTVCKSRDKITLKAGMKVWYFDPYDKFSLKTALIIEIFAYGPSLSIGSGSLLYSRHAVWATEVGALSDGPPRHIYGPLSDSRTTELKKQGHKGIFVDEPWVRRKYEGKPERPYAS